MKKSAGRKQARMAARNNRRAAGRLKASHNEWLQRYKKRAPIKEAKQNLSTSLYHREGAFSESINGH